MQIFVEFDLRDRAAKALKCARYKTSNLQEATARTAGPYLVPGSGFIGAAAIMLKCASRRLVIGRVGGLAGVESMTVQSVT